MNSVSENQSLSHLVAVVTFIRHTESLCAAAEVTPHTNSSSELIAAIPAFVLYPEIGQEMILVAEPQVVPPSVL